jgi:hypothetical protein
MKWLVLLSLMFSFWLGGNEAIARAGKLAERVENYPQLTSKPSLTVANGDLVYPQWLAGRWLVTSIFVDRRAPLATEIITPGFESNRHDQPESIQFSVRFIEKAIAGPRRSFLPSPIIGKVGIIADRAFNSLAIGRAYLGEKALLSVKVDPDHPNQQITFFRGDRQVLTTVVRRGVETPTGDRFIATELSQQTFRGGGDLYFNEVEITTDYHRLDTDHIVAEQIAAVYLSPSDRDYFRALDRPVALYRYRLEMSRVATEPTR